MPPRALKAEQLIEDMQAASGNLAAVARKYGIKRQSVWEFVQRHPTCLAAWNDERQELVDVAESALKRQVLAGDTTAIIFTLKTQGRDRGYNEKVDISQSGKVEHQHSHEHDFDLAAYTALFNSIIGDEGESGERLPEGDDQR